MKEKQRKSNFAIGQGAKPVFSNETSSSQAYTADKHRQDATKALQPNNRGTNFKFGSTSLTYDTQTAQNNQRMVEQLKSSNPTEQLA
jgi:hypothetical protein